MSDIHSTFIITALYSVSFYHFEAETKCLTYADDIFKCIFFKENYSILIQISLKFLHKDQINKLALNRWQAIIWSNDSLVYWYIYLLLGLRGVEWTGLHRDFVIIATKQNDVECIKYIPAL